MPMLNADERSPLDAAINALGELSIERYFAGSPPAVSIPPERETELPVGSSISPARAIALAARFRPADPQATTRIAAVLARIALGTRATVWLHPNREPLDAEISEVLFRAITLKADQFLAPGSAVEVQFNGDIAVRGTVIRCQPREGIFYVRLTLFDARLQSADREARRDERFAVRIPGTLRVADSVGSICMIEVMDVSRLGLRVRCEHGLPQGTQIHLNCRGTSIRGEVRYSRQVSLDDYHIGIYALSIFRESIRLKELDLTMLRDAG